MMLNKKGLNFLHFFTLTVLVLTVFGCAVPQKPQGGPKDVTPPKLLKATPANSTHNFSSKTIRLEFDEFFKFNNQYQEITISPAQEKTPEYKIDKKALVINLKDTLQKNTTYVINFGKAIGDVTENNILKNFTYVFSTGTHIDSLTLAGNVTNIQTQQREKDVLVMLFTLKEDSLKFGKKKPSVFTTTDTAGNFTIGNLHEGQYRLYALKETAANKIYDNDNELIAFPSKIINLQNDTAGIQLHLFKADPPKFRFSAHQFDPDGKLLLVFNKPVDKPSIKIIYPKAIDDNKYVDIAKTKDTAMVYLKNMDFDSLRVVLYSNNKTVDSVSVRKGRKETFVHSVAIRTSADNGNILKPGTDLKIFSNTPIVNYEPSQITLMEDSNMVSNYNLTRDTANQKYFTLKYPWKQNVTYTLTFNEGALTGFFGEQNKKIPKKFKLDKPQNYSQLTLKVTVPDTARSYIVELLNDQSALLRSDVIRKSTSIVYKNYLTGKYHFRVIYDDNNNGKWDTGSVKEKRQPENIWVDKNIIPLRPNWEAIESLTIPREPNL
ncbi:MAG: Ig-like domain-containing protein [Mucilaginibacter sp.]